MPITFRKATLSDIDELVRLRIDFLKDVQDENNCAYTDLDLAKSLYNYFSESLKNDAFIAWLAVFENEIIATSGLCFYQIAPNFNIINGQNAYILNIYTIPAWRGKGIGKQIFDYILQEAINRGYKKISLHASEEGKHIYKKFGFEFTNDEMLLKIPN